MAVMPTDAAMAQYTHYNEQSCSVYSCKLPPQASTDTIRTPYVLLICMQQPVKVAASGVLIATSGAHAPKKKKQSPLVRSALARDSHMTRPSSSARQGPCRKLAAQASILRIRRQHGRRPCSDPCREGLHARALCRGCGGRRDGTTPPCPQKSRHQACASRPWWP